MDAAGVETDRLRQLKAQAGLAFHDRSLAHAAMQNHSVAARDRERARQLNPTLDAQAPSSSNGTASVEMSQSRAAPAAQ